MPGWLRRTLTVIALLALAGLLVWAFIPTPEAVEVGVVTRGELSVVVEDEGETRVRDRYFIAAPITGRMQRIVLDPGDVVAPGDVLARIAPPAAGTLDARARDQARAVLDAAAANVARAEAQISQLEAELAFARSERGRIEQLREADAVPQRQLDEAITLERSRAEALRAAQWTHRIAEHELEQARAALRAYGPDHDNDADMIVLTAPVHAHVLRVLERSERHVAPGAPLLELGDIARLEVVVDVLSDDASRIAAGMEARIVRYADGRTWPGRVRLVEPAAFTEVSALGVEEQRVNVIVDFTDEARNWQVLGDAFRVDVGVILWQADDVIRVPTSALFRHDGQWAVFRVVDGRARLQRVEIGRQTPQHSQVIAGLEVDDIVVLYPDDRIDDGTRLEPR